MLLLYMRTILTQHSIVSQNFDRNFHGNFPARQCDLEFHLSKYFPVQYWEKLLCKYAMHFLSKKLTSATWKCNISLFYGWKKKLKKRIYKCTCNQNVIFKNRSQLYDVQIILLFILKQKWPIFHLPILENCCSVCSFTFNAEACWIFR